MSAANFVVAIGSKLCEEQIALVRVDEYGIAMGSHMGAGSVPQLRHFVSLPDLPAGAGVQADKFTG